VTDDGATVVVEARSFVQLDQVRALVRAFVGWHQERHVGDRHLIDAYVDPDAVEAELAGLPGAYARPQGRLLLALRVGAPVGCVALKRLDEQACEMKRMFVPPRFQGLGVGRALAAAVVAEAREAGYEAIWLDTSVRQVEALGLYRSLGFEEVGPYYDLPPDLARWLVILRKVLRAGDAAGRLGEGPGLG
jgi:ribosomal protein S18 acetylase RimI-like enzyme